MLSLFSRQLSKAIDEAKSQAIYAKKVVSNIESRGWLPKKKRKIKSRTYHVNTADENEETVSWGSDFSDSCSDDAEDGEIEEEEEGDGEGEGEEEEDYEDGLSSNRVTRCGSYSLCETDSSSQPHTESISGSTTYENTYEAISETPSTSSYCGSSENSSAFYETPPERRRDSVTTCPSDTDKSSSSGIGQLSGSTRSNSDHDQSELSSLNCAINEYGVHNSRALSMEITSEYIRRELNRKEVITLNRCEVSSETSSGMCSAPSPIARTKPKIKPAIPPKPNIALRPKPPNPAIRKKVRRKIVRPTGEPPPPPVPKSPPPLSPASSKTSLTDRLAELTLDDLNEVLGVKMTWEAEDNRDESVSKSSTLTATNISNTINLNNLETTICTNSNQEDKKKENLTVNNNFDADHDKGEESGDYETPINVKETNNVNNIDNSGVNSSRRVSRSSSVASGSIIPDSGFSDCTGISPYPISPPPPFDDNYCCSCKRLMKSVGSTPNLNTTPELSEICNSSTTSSTTTLTPTSLRSSLVSSNSHHNLTTSVSLTNGCEIDRPKLPRCTKESISGTSLKAELAAKFAEKAMSARKLIHSRPSFKSSVEAIYASVKSFPSSVNHNNNSISSLSGILNNPGQRPLPPLPDDVMPIEKYSWFHDLEREASAGLLRDLGTEGAYLVRPSKRAGQSNPLSLSIFHQGKVFHLNIRKRSDGLYSLGKEKDKERTFSTVPELIRFHQVEPILLTTKGESAGITKLMVIPTPSST